MNHQPHDSRRQAAHNFVNALDELELVLKSKQPEIDEPDDTKSTRHPDPAPSGEQSAAWMEDADLGQLLDDAVKDIEQFMAADESSQQDT
ncbi:MAG: hypothetical protein AAGG53_02375 [Cyanobacteria bacterium P01_H01_bin.152]